MIISAYFASSGVPATGLSPVINIRDLSDNSLVVPLSAIAVIGVADLFDHKWRKVILGSWMVVEGATDLHNKRLK